MTVKVLKSWANCTQFMNVGEFITLPDEQGRQFVKEGIASEVKNVPENAKVRAITDSLAEVV